MDSDCDGAVFAAVGATTDRVSSGPISGRNQGSSRIAATRAARESVGVS